MSDPYADATNGATNRSAQLDHVLATLLRQAPDVEAAAVVSFDGLPMASALPAGMDEDRVAAMSAALLSLGERAAQGLGRGDLSQVYVEGDNGTVFLVSADDEAVLVAVGRHGAKVGLMLFEVKQAADAIAMCLRAEPEMLAPSLVAVSPAPVIAPPAIVPAMTEVPTPTPISTPTPVATPVPTLPETPTIAPVSVMPVATTTTYVDEQNDETEATMQPVLASTPADDDSNWEQPRSAEPVPTIAPEPGVWS